MRKNFIEKTLHALPHSNEQDEYSERSMMRGYFVEELKNLYWSEKSLFKNLPRIQNAAVMKELQELLEDHSSVTDDHVERVEEIFSLLQESPQIRKCEPIDAALKELAHLNHKLEQSSFTKDLTIVSAINKIQHYQISVYQNLLHIVTLLREPFIEGILQRSLNDELKTLGAFALFSRTHLTEANLLETENEH